MITKAIEDDLSPVPSARSFARYASEKVWDWLNWAATQVCLQHCFRSWSAASFTQPCRIAMVFSVGLDYFFTDERKRRVVAIVRKG
jgi:hypothetical protein